jgi:hypothetical protein
VLKGGEGGKTTVGDSALPSLEGFFSHHRDREREGRRWLLKIPLHRRQRAVVLRCPSLLINFFTSFFLIFLIHLFFLTWVWCDGYSCHLLIGGTNPLFMQ